MFYENDHDTCLTDFKFIHFSLVGDFQNRFHFCNIKEESNEDKSEIWKEKESSSILIAKLPV